MLNYIWGGLIVLSLVFALTSDLTDFVQDTYRNGTPLPITITFDEEYNADARRQYVDVQLLGSDLATHYGDSSITGNIWPGILLQTSAGRELRFAAEASLVEPLQTICQETGQDDCRGALQGTPTSAEWQTTINFWSRALGQDECHCLCCTGFCQDSGHSGPRTDWRPGTVDGASQDRRSVRHAPCTGPLHAAAHPTALPEGPQGSPRSGDDRPQPFRKYAGNGQCSHAPWDQSYARASDTQRNRRQLQQTRWSCCSP